MCPFKIRSQPLIVYVHNWVVQVARFYFEQWGLSCSLCWILQDAIHIAYPVAFYSSAPVEVFSTSFCACVTSHLVHWIMCCSVRLPTNPAYWCRHSSYIINEDQKYVVSRDSNGIYIVYAPVLSRVTSVLFVPIVAVLFLRVGCSYDLTVCVSHFALSPTPRCLAHKAVYPSAWSICMFMTFQLLSGICLLRLQIFLHCSHHGSD